MLPPFSVDLSGKLWQFTRRTYNIRASSSMGLLPGMTMPLLLLMFIVDASERYCLFFWPTSSTLNHDSFHGRATPMSPDVAAWARGG